MSAIGRGLVSVVFASAVAGAAIAFAQSNLATLSSITPPEMKFVPDPERPGAASVVLVGDPSKAGVYVMHRRIPAHSKGEPHSHSDVWRIMTILSGTLYYGYGDTFDESKLKALGPGSVAVEPKDQPHFGMTKDEAVTVQIVAERPTATNPVRK